MKFISKLFILFFLTGSFTYAQIYNPVEWISSVEKVTESEFNLVITANIDDGWHLYSQNVPDGGPIPTNIVFEENNELYQIIGKPTESKGHEEFDRKPIDPLSFARDHKLSDKPIVAVLPGSRKQEIAKMLSVMLKMVPKFPDHQFVIAGAPSQELDFYKKFFTSDDIALVENKTYDLLSVAAAALVTSGTATLETALFKVPEVVCYKGNEISYQIGKRLVNIKFISLVNLILEREVVTELIQDEFNESNLENELFKILDHKHREEMFDQYYQLERKLGGKGASEKTAKLIIKYT